MTVNLDHAIVCTHTYHMCNSLQIKQNTFSQCDVEDSLYCMPKPRRWQYMMACYEVAKAALVLSHDHVYT